MTATGNVASGVYITGSIGTDLAGGSLNGNGDSGVAIDGTSSEVTVRDNIADGNTVGVYIGNSSTDNSVHDNQAFSNSYVDLDDENASCDSNDWFDNSFDTRNQSCIS